MCVYVCVSQDVSDSDSPRSGGRQVVILELSGQASWTIDARQGTPWAAPAGQEPQRAPRQPQEPEEPVSTGIVHTHVHCTRPKNHIPYAIIGQACGHMAVNHHGNRTVSRHVCHAAVYRGPCEGASRLVQTTTCTGRCAWYGGVCS